MDDETYARLKAGIEAGIEAANQGRTKDLGDFAQYAEDEPAWRRELRATAHDSLGCYTQDEVLAVILPHIKAAEERGRREALKEAAEKIRRAYSGDEPDHSWVNNPYDAATLIDPESP